VSTSLTTASTIEEGLAKEELRKKRRRKPYIRYERALAAGEFKNANTENSTALVDKLVEDYWSIMPLEELTTEVSSELTERMVKRNGAADSSVTLNS